ncbi:MAG: ATP-binding protein [Bradyrhizobiaceae bacterium]|nr:ATP-binding protein [Bradyrhizobiaceae bacterium]
MTVNLNVLDHLGINLYSNIAAVMTEAVANAWDADATEVRIDALNPGTEEQKIVIEDNGIGMSVEDMNDKYLNVGYRRREEDTDTGRVTARNRRVMGRKGLGKLSLFSIAEIIEVESSKTGVVPHGLRMTVEGIRIAAKEKTEYHPEPLEESELTVSQGTTITLKQIRRKRLSGGVNALRKRLARRFSIMGADQEFMVYINGTPITPADRDDLAGAQFLWNFDGTDIDPTSIPRIQERAILSNRKDDWPSDWRIQGWLATVRKPKELDNIDSGNLNGIVVFSRGRLFHENILDKLNDGRLFTKYLTGQIDVDFMDKDDDEDIATSDRQRIQESDPRYEALVAFLKEILGRVDGQWNEWRRKHTLEEITATIPAVTIWLDGLKPGHRESARRMLSGLGAVKLDEEEDKKELIKYGVLAFERMALRGSESDFAANADNPEELLRLFSSRDSFEAALYRDIVSSRMSVIERLKGLVDEDVQESVLRDYLFEHLWLLDPSWERADGSAEVETRLREEGVIVDTLTEKEKLGRVDLRYRTYAGKHIILELKRAGVKPTLNKLFEQGRLYSTTLRKILRAMDIESPNVEVIFVIGRQIDEEISDPEGVKSAMTSIAPGSRIVHYDGLIRGAMKSYSEYLEADDRARKLYTLIDQIST